MLLKQSTARSVVVLMIDASDHVTGKTGLTLTINASKNGAAFATITPTVTELAYGFYTLALTTSQTDTLGDLALHVTATGADPTDQVWQVVADLPGAGSTDSANISAIKAKTDNLPAAPAAVGDIPTATQNADALLKRDMSAVSGEAARSPLNALRWLRNKWSISGGTLTVTKEDDTTTAWSGTVTQTATNPTTAVDPS